MAQNTLPRTDPLSILQRTVDFGPYAAAPGSPIWVRSLATLAQNNLGALALVGPSGINLLSGTGFRERSEIEAAALYLSALADTVAKSRQQLGLAYPPCARHLPLLFAVAAVLSTAVSSNNRSDGQASAPIFLVSPDLELRSSYCDVYVRNVSLDEAFPGTRLLPSGAVERLTPRSGTRSANGVCFFLPGLNLPRRLTFRPQLTILDLRCSRWTSRLETIVPWARDLGTGLLVIYTLGDADTEQALQRLREMTRVCSPETDRPIPQGITMLECSTTSRMPSHGSAAAPSLTWPARSNRWQLQGDGAETADSSPPSTQEHLVQ